VFQIVAVPFDAFQALPCAKSRWLLTCFSRYADRAGKAFPSLRQLARDARMSLASVSRYMSALERLGVFQRQRQPGGRYRYTLGEAYRPRWPGCVPAEKRGVSQTGTQQANPTKETPKK
jgi:DNA-binding transcriptional MocR family regulator